MANQEQYREMSRPLLSDDDHEMRDTPYQDGNSGLEMTGKPTTFTSETDISGDALPEYQDVTPPYTLPSVGDYKYDDVDIEQKGQKEERDETGDEEDEDEEPSVRRGCCGRSRRAKRKSDKRCRRFRRVFVFFKIFFVVCLLSFLFARNCAGSKRQPKDFMWTDCLQVEYNSQNRQIVRETGSRSIWGRYPLYDLLSLKTTSGSIAVTIEPQPADPDHPDEPARLVLETVTGAVVVSFAHPQLDAIFERDEMMIEFEEELPFVPDQEDIKAFKRTCKKNNKKTHWGYKVDKTTTQKKPDAIQYRPYEIVIKTDSGSVSGKLIFSSSAHVESHTGSISAGLIPLVSSSGEELSSKNITLETRSHSGSQTIVLANPFRVASSSSSSSSGSSHQGESVSSLRAISSHVSNAGHIDVVYPNSWAGTVEAATHAGTVCLDGPGLEVSKDGQGHASAVKFADEHAPKHWWGSRGDMNVSLEARGSGSINFLVDSPFDSR